ncbi:MAG: protoheme IX farnesyltransferase [Blastocatellia bacterium]|nr:protoheme IX farnesyltransferase [Blastocatellia bacterium]
MATPANIIAVNQPLTMSEKIGAYVELTKPRITFMVVLSALAGFCLASKQGINWLQFLHFAVGVSLLTSGTSTLNQFIERESDKLMRRTMRRPLPAGRLSPIAALMFGLTTAVLGEAYLALVVNPLTAWLGVAALVSYVLMYTPLKQRTTLCTAIGAFPGALPPLLGWAAASNELAIGGCVMFAILFLWQFPHFHAIAMMYAEDYARADIKMLPVVEPDLKSTSLQIVGYAALLLPVSFLPFFLGMSGWVYLFAAILLGIGFLYASINCAETKTKKDARILLKTSVIYLPLLYIVMVLNS